MRTLIESRWFALAAFILVIVSGICLYVLPQFGIWTLLPPLILWTTRCVVRGSLYQHPLLIGSLIVFDLTAAVGCWAAYDETAAWNKFCLILAAILFGLVMAGQPLENLKPLGGFWFLIGFGIAAYFLLTFDFSSRTAKFQLIHELGLAWMRLRPISFQIPSIHPNDVAGMTIIMSVYGLALFSGSRDRLRSGYVLKFLILVGFGIVLLAVLLASSRGAYLALAGSLAIWLLGRSLQLARSPVIEKLSHFFPAIVVIGTLLLGMLVLTVPSGLLGPSFSVAGNVVVSRAEVFRSGLSIMRDFSFTGGGLGSFPGLYSQYVLALPYFALLHSHNMFLDVMIEQGILGGVAFIAVYLVVIWQLLTAWMNDRSSHTQHLYFAACISLFTAILHGWVDDYIYGGGGTMLAFVPAAMAVLVSRMAAEQNPGTQRIALPTLQRSRLLWLSSVTLAIVALVIGLRWNAITAQWYANLGAVKMAKADLADYPADKWSDGENLFKLASAKLDFQRALVFQPENKTANHRLGLISMYGRDFESATEYLQKAYEQDVENRGVIKNLGYSYLWFGEIEKAESFLIRIPEAKHELDVYIWWWNDHQRPDLSDRASGLATSLAAQP